MQLTLFGLLMMTYTRDGHNEYIHNIEELIQVVDEEKVEKAYGNEE